MKLWILRKKQSQQIQRKNKQKKVINNLYAIFEDTERVLVAFESKIFPKKIEGAGFLDRKGDKVSDHSNLKILTSKQMVQRLPIALAQVKVDNTSENLVNEIRQTIYSLYRAKKLPKKYIIIQWIQ